MAGRKIALSVQQLVRSSKTIRYNTGRTKTIITSINHIKNLLKNLEPVKINFEKSMRTTKAGKENITINAIASIFLIFNFFLNHF